MAEKEYIEREALIKRLEVTPILKHGIPAQVRDGVIDLVEKQPAADVAPVVHGRWLEAHHQSLIPVEYDDSGNPILHNYTTYCCDQCGRREGKKEPYCNCGAKMDLEGGNT